MYNDKKLLNQNPFFDMEQIIAISASMLETKNGFCVKVETQGEPICFFVDKTFKQVPWKLTITKGMILDKREFWRMRREWKLNEVSLSETQLAKAIAIAKLIHADPYLGLTVKQKKKHIQKNFSINTTPSTSTPEQKGKKARQEDYTKGGAKLGTVFGGLFKQIKQNIQKTA